jgi:hypothetical protein
MGRSFFVITNGCGRPFAYYENILLVVDGMESKRNLILNNIAREK